MTNTTNTIRTAVRGIAATLAAAALSFSIAGAAQAQVRTQVIGKTMQMPNPQLLNQMKAAQNRRAQLRIKGFNKATQKLLNGKSSAGQKLRAKGNAARQLRQNPKMRQMFKQKLTNGPKGILKNPARPRSTNTSSSTRSPLARARSIAPSISRKRTSVSPASRPRRSRTQGTFVKAT